MFRALITTIPFRRIPTQSNPEWNHLPQAILADITNFIHLERLFYPNKQPLYNTKPFIHIAKHSTHNTLDTIPLPEYKALARKYCTHYLIDKFARDLSVYNNSDNKLLVSRNWINYNQHTRLLRIICVDEIFDYHVEFARYLEYLNNILYPNFDTKDNNHKMFLAKLQTMSNL
jgi:hypothetical protein